MPTHLRAVPTLLLFAALIARVPAAADPPPAQPPASDPGPAAAEAATDPPRGVYDDTLEVRERAADLVGRVDSATEGYTGRADLAVRPVLRAGELLETVPGLIVTQHSGGGKANQYFLRGFNLDHGTDFRVTLDGVPLNLSTHGHGQGYADLAPLVPELIDHVRYRKGPYFAEEGDFAAAGAARIHYVDALEQPIVSLAPGEDGYARGLAAASTTVAGGTLLGALELAHQDGPWELPEDHRRGNLVLRYSRGDAAAGMRLGLAGYEGRWDATDQIPRRAVSDGLVGRFGTLDPSDGGRSRRYALTGERWRGDARGTSSLSAYLVRYELDLFSNFTYFLDDEENGDQFAQRDQRSIVGLDWTRRRTLPLGGTRATRTAELAYGLGGRFDHVDNGLYRTRERVRLGTTREDTIDLATGGAWVELATRWTPWLRSTAGLRGDLWRAEVDASRRENSGERQDQLLSPKLTLVFGPWRETELYLNAGFGFHSNDARGATLAVDPASGEPARRVEPLVRARGLDLGVRSELLRGYRTALTTFVLDLDSELVFVGDAGGTEASRPSRRVGIEWQNHWHPLPWLRLDADLALSRGRFRDDRPEGDHIPGAIERALNAGVAVDDLDGWFGALRLRYFGPRPLVEDDSVRSRSSTLVSARLGYAFPLGGRAHGLRLGIEVFNLLDAEVDDIAYFYASRPAPGAPAREDVHFHPAEPRTVRLLLGWSR
jgi:hypothetical protein